MTLTGTMLGILLLTLFLIGFPEESLYFGKRFAERDFHRWVVIELLFWLGGLFIIFLSVFIKKYEWTHRIIGWDREPIYWHIGLFGVLLFICAVVLAITLLVGHS